VKRAGYSTTSISARVAATKGAAHRRGKLWMALRILRNTTVDELLTVAEQDNRDSVVVFLSQLRRAGFVSARYGNPGRHEPTRYFLQRNTGPRCPALIKRGRVVYDPNTETEHPIK